ncbi:hypothetical protein Tco_0433318 [Tanacetum coccineum]
MALAKELMGTSILQQNQPSFTSSKALKPMHHHHNHVSIFENGSFRIRTKVVVVKSAISEDIAKLVTKSGEKDSKKGEERNTNKLSRRERNCTCGRLLARIHDWDAEDALSKLLQTGTVAEYESKFVILISRVTGKSESLLKTFYISGLKPALQCALLRSNPSTLGEAFFKARFTEARFEDERSTIAIAKTNDLNTGVHVQDLELETKVLVDGKQDDAKVVGVAGHQNSDEPNVLKGNGVTGVGVNENNKWVDKEVQYSVYTLHVLIPFFKRLNDKYIKKKKDEGFNSKKIMGSWNQEFSRQHLEGNVVLKE